VLPIVQTLLKAGGGAKRAFGRKPLVVVLAPTRELAKQVRGSCCRRAASPRPIRVCLGSSTRPAV
jgi:superfamily II DNA/RNA helicase